MTFILLGLLNTWMMQIGAAALLVGAAFCWFQFPVIGQYAAIALVAVAMFMFGSANGYDTARDACQDDRLKQELFTANERANLLLAQREAAMRMQTERADEAKAALALADEQRKRADDLETQFRSAAAACDFTPDELRRVRDQLRVGPGR